MQKTVSISQRPKTALPLTRTLENSILSSSNKNKFLILLPDKTYAEAEDILRERSIEKFQEEARTEEKEEEKEVEEMERFESFEKSSAFFYDNEKYYTILSSRFDLRNPSFGSKPKSKDEKTDEEENDNFLGKEIEEEVSFHAVNVSIAVKRDVQYEETFDIFVNDINWPFKLRAKSRATLQDVIVMNTPSTTSAHNGKVQYASFFFLSYIISC